MTPRLAFLLALLVLVLAWIVVPRPVPPEHRVAPELAGRVG